MIYDGLDDATWSIQEIFDTYFPGLHRRSCFITMYGLLEHDVEGLCKRYIRTSALQLKPQDLKGSGIVRSKLYLQKVVGLDASKWERAWSKVKELQALKNLIVHNNSQMIDGKEKNFKNVEFVSMQGSEVVLEKGFLEYALNCFEEFCGIVHESVKAQSDKRKLEND